MPAAVEGFLKQLLLTYKGVVFYPPSSTFPRDSGERAAEMLRAILSTRAEVRLVVAKDRLFFEEIEVFPGQDAFNALALEFYNRGVAEVRFRAGTRGREFTDFFGLLRVPPEEIAAEGGFEARLWELDVTSIDVVESRVQVVDEIARDGADLAPDADEVERVLSEYSAGKPVDHKVLLRTVGDAGALSSYLAGQLDNLDEASGSRIKDVAHIAADLPAAERASMFHSIADAMKGLDPEALRCLLADHVLPEARTDDALASVVRQFDVDDVCRMLVDELKADRITSEGLSRALRNLALVSIAERSEVVDAAGAAMRGAGFGESEVDDVVERVAPARITIAAPAASASSSQPVDTVLQLLDFAPLQTWSSEDDPELAALEQEARMGVADGDILGVLVTLVTAQADAERWASIMATLESSLELLVARGEFEIASDAAEALRLAAESESFTIMQRTRLAAAIGLLARPEDVKALTRALRVFEPETETHQAALRLLGLLSDRATGPLLELLAEEPDRATRKSLVDLLSELANDNLAEVGKQVTDRRWYFVRNVVSVLGSTKNPAILQYLMSTTRHPDARVRRESIRALSGLSDRAASHLLVTALGDDDAQNVQLAARYLGTARVVGAIPALVLVARGESRGNCDVSVRVEAVEALGRIGTAEAVTVLAELSGRRAAIGPKGTREVRVAAQAALDGLKKEA